MDWWRKIQGDKELFIETKSKVLKKRMFTILTNPMIGQHLNDEGLVNSIIGCQTKFARRRPINQSP